MVADRYVGASSWTKRIVREHYDQPVPKTNRGITTGTNGSSGTNGTHGNGRRAGAGARVTPSA
jgi:uncharacterized spore protein YtfJ